MLKFFETYTTDVHGQIFLFPTMDVTGYTQISVEFATSLRTASNMIVNCNMGWMEGETVSATVSQFPLGGAGRRSTRFR